MAFDTCKPFKLLVFLKSTINSNPILTSIFSTVKTITYITKNPETPTYIRGAEGVQKNHSYGLLYRAKISVHFCRGTRLFI